MYVLMKAMERAPSRYDRGIEFLTLGSLPPLYDRIASYVERGQRVLDIGCGTGSLALRAAQRGAKVVGIDVNPAMLEIAHRKAEQSGLTTKVQFQEKGVGELEEFPPETFDVVMSGLCLSELPPQEQDYTVSQAYRLLKPRGLLLIVDEAEPPHPLKRCLLRLIRIPLTLLSLLIARTITYPLKDFPRRVTGAGFELRSVEYHGLGNLMVLIAQKERQDALCAGEPALHSL